MKLSALFLTSALVIATIPAQAGIHAFLTAESLFVCNAGIVHPEHPGVLVPGTDSSVVVYEDFSMPVDSEARFPSENLTVIAGSPAKKFVTAELDAWTQNIVATSFHLATERYGTSYFVDVCYRGPVKQIKNGQDESLGIYNLTMNAQVSSANTGDSYQENARLSASVDVSCDLRNRGQLTAARTGSETKPAGTETDSLAQTGFVSFQQKQLQVGVNLNNQFQQVPRFCKIRFLIKENATSTPRAFRQTPKDIDLFIDISK